MSDATGQAGAERELIERYLESWNEFDPARRRKRIDELWAEDGRYVDPDDDATGRDAIAGVLTAARDRLGTLIFTLGEVISVHHDLALFTWQARPSAAAEPVAAGYDAAEFTGGQVKLVYGFFVAVTWAAAGE
jgi:hypothetical protein